MWQDSYGITKGQSILVNCPECVSREIEKKKKQLEADFKAAEEEGTEFRSPSYREMEDEIDFEDLGFKVIATSGTSNLLNQNGVFSDSIFKV